MKKLFFFVSLLCLLSAFLIFISCKHNEPVNPVFDISTTEKNTAASAFVSYIYSDDLDNDGQKIQMTVWKDPNFSSHYDKDGYFWEGLMYKLEGSGPFYEFMLKHASTQGKIWKRPEDSYMPYPNWFLEAKNNSNTPGRVTIGASDDNGFYLSVGVASHLRRFVAESDDCGMPNPFTFDYPNP